MMFRIAAQAFLMAMLCVVANPSPVPEMFQEAKVTTLLTKDLAGLTGKEAAMLTVEYAPGASSSKHRHNANTFVYVLEGSIVMQVEGGNAVTLGPGQTFYESPDDIHAVSKNASDSKPARFLVFFVKDKGAIPLVPVK
jgi:quercetin dioxygenase-like cupin family protein